MKRIVVYGCKNLENRRLVENFLGRNYSILGYSDSFEMDDYYEEGAFFNPKKLLEVDADYIVLAMFNNQHITDVCDMLNSIGISSDKIINPLILRPHSPVKYNENLIRKVKIIMDDSTASKYKGVIFGLSYSLKGIDKEELCVPFLDCSWSGMDLYYNYQMYKFVRKGKLTGIKDAWLVMPFYYFDYDQSISYAQYTSGQIFAIYELDDWHNVMHMKKNLYEAINYINNFRLFGEKITDYYHYKWRKRENTWMSCDNEEKQLQGLWCKDYPITRQENIHIFHDFINTLHSDGMNISVIVPPLLTSGMDFFTRERVGYLAKRFRDIIDGCAIDVQYYDFSGLFEDNGKLFRDREHLNNYGTEAFTSFLNEHILFS